MIGAAMIENDNPGLIIARSMMELLNAAYTLHPAFAEAEIMEIGVGMRSAYADNLPRVKRKDRVISINGFYRHGYLLAPEMAKQAADIWPCTARIGMQPEKTQGGTPLILPAQNVRNRKYFSPHVFME